VALRVRRGRKLPELDGVPVTERDDVQVDARGTSLVASTWRLSRPVAERGFRDHHERSATGPPGAVGSPAIETSVAAVTVSVVDTEHAPRVAVSCVLPTATARRGSAHAARQAVHREGGPPAPDESGCRARASPGSPVKLLWREFAHAWAPAGTRDAPTSAHKPP